MIYWIIFIVSLVLLIVGIRNVIWGIRRTFKDVESYKENNPGIKQIEKDTQKVANVGGCGCLLIIVFGIILLIVGTVVFWLKVTVD